MANLDLFSEELKQGVGSSRSLNPHILI